VACKVGRGESVRGPVVEVAGSACKPNRRAAEGDQKRREVAHEQEQHGEIEGHGAFVGKERSNREDPGRLNADACTGRRSEASVRLSRDRKSISPTFLTGKTDTGSILHPDAYELWLDPGMKDVSAASDLLKPCDAQLMRCYPVSTRINHVANDDEECSRPVELAQIQDDPFS
jgi:hypothetical protein